MDSSILLAKIQAFYEARKRMPTVREIRDTIIRTKSMRKTKQLLDALVDEGYVLRDNKGRLMPAHLFTSIRTLGRVEAGWPSPAEEELLDTMTIDELLIKRREATFLLEVSGNSMINAGIQPGDMALIERGREPKHGDIVIAQVDNKWTMKYFHKLAGGKVALVPANPKYSTIYPKEELSIEAVVIAIVRKYK